MQHTHGQQGHLGPQIAALSKEKIEAEIEQLKNVNKTMVLATKTVDNKAEVSYLPYIYLNDRYYIILTKSASHYENIVQAKTFQGMIIESEQEAVSTFFRKRLIFNFMYEGINESEEVAQQFVAVHGPLTHQVLKMNFNIFALKVVDARVILGPGQAYHLDGSEKVQEQIIKGHE